METTNLQNTDLTVSRIGMGCSQIASASSPRSEREVTDAIHCALDMGINLFDTADSYGQGDSEIRLGRALKGRRDQVVIATKAGYCFGHSGGVLRKLKPVVKPIIRLFPAASGAVRRARSSAMRQNFSVSHVRAALDASLRRLQTDHVDLFLLHNPPSNVMRNFELLNVLDGLVKAGKARYWGVSCRQGSDALQMTTEGPVTILQLPVSVAEPGACDSLLAALRQVKPGIIAREVFGRGVLADPPPALGALLAQSGLSPWHAALRFALSQQGVDTALVGMSRVSNVISAGTLFRHPDLPPEIRSALQVWRRLDQSRQAKPT